MDWIGLKYMEWRCKEKYHGRGGNLNPFGGGYRIGSRETAEDPRRKPTGRGSENRNNRVDGESARALNLRKTIVNPVDSSDADLRANVIREPESASGADKVKDKRLKSSTGLMACASDARLTRNGLGLDSASKFIGCAKERK